MGILSPIFFVFLLDNSCMFYSEHTHAISTKGMLFGCRKRSLGNFRVKTFEGQGILVEANKIQDILWDFSVKVVHCLLQDGQWLSFVISLSNSLKYVSFPCMFLGTENCCSSLERYLKTKTNKILDIIVMMTVLHKYLKKEVYYQLSGFR